MLPEEKSLYWFTPFFKRTEVNHFIKQFDKNKCSALFCHDLQWNSAVSEDLQYLQKELKQNGYQLITLDGGVEKTVPSVAKVLKAGKVFFQHPENHREFEPSVNRICRELELHSIAFCKKKQHYISFLNTNNQRAFRNAI